jgi:uncharacterized protein YjbI with pentapeptide repeats
VALLLPGGTFAVRRAEPRVVERPWVLEAELAADPLLHATLDQTIVLDLEGQRKSRGRGHGRGVVRRNEVRLLVEEERRVRLCIPEDEPHLLWLALRRLPEPGRHARGRKVWRRVRGGPCRPFGLEPGRYQLDVYHDARKVGRDGKSAFLHRPARRRHLRSVAIDGPGGTLQEQLVYPVFFAAAAGANSVGPRYLRRDTSVQPNQVVLSANTGGGVVDGNVWSFYEAATDMSGFSNSRPMAPWAPPAGWPPSEPLSIELSMNGQVQLPPLTLLFHPSTHDCIGQVQNQSYCTMGFILNEAGETYSMWADNYALSLAWPFPWIVADVGSGNVPPLLLSDVPGDSPPVEGTPFFDFTFIGYPNAKLPPLQQGQFALYGSCDADATAFVFDADVDLDDFSGMATAAITPPREIHAVKLGPSTFLEVSTDGQPTTNIGGDVACASPPIEADEITLFVDVLEFIATTDACHHCNLAGIDFSGKDFSGVDFTGAIFTGADLAGTNFSDANFTDADLNAIGGQNGSSLAGAIFTGANLSCTSFQSSALGDASFGQNTFVTDRSCVLDLSGATLDFTTLSVTDWRWFDLSSSTVADVPAALSTESAPLDLSGANLSRVTWLRDVQLDAVNFGCFARTPSQTEPCPDASGTPACTTLQGTDLSKASLVGACLAGGNLQGASLTEANLDGADLSGAKLLGLGDEGSPATLTGAFLRNASLAGADLTGVDADAASFYSGIGGTADASGATMTGARFEGAYLANVDFSEAVLQSTIWTGAILAGASFENADLSKNVAADQGADFTGAFLHGAVFDQAVVTAADFTDSYWDLTGSGTLNVLLPTANLQFRGYWNDPTTPECVGATYPTPTFPSAGPPTTTASNRCPDSGSGPCDGRWESPLIPIEQALPPTALDPALPGSCTSTDVLWLFAID